VLPAGFTALRPLPVPLGETTAAALNGKIYVAGGFDTSPSFQIYDIATDTWEPGPNLPAGTDNACSVTVGNRVFVLGGEAGMAMQIFDTASKTWTAGVIPEPRFSSVAAVLEGKIHLVGGWSFDRSNDSSIASHTVFDPAAGTFFSGAAPLHVARNSASNIPGGEVYDPATGSWTDLPPLNVPRSGGAAAVLDGKLYVLGGGLPRDALYKTVERFDPAGGTWETLPDLPEGATGQSAVASGGSIYIIGGFASVNGKRVGEGGIATVYRYTPN
jgi:hypothetical protein